MGFAILSEDYYTRWVSPHPDGLTDDNLVLAQQLMRKEGFERTVFYDRDTPLTRMEFLEWARCERKMLFMQFKRDGTPISLCWLTNPSNTGCQTFSHFTTLGTVPREESIVSGKMIIAFIGKLTKVRQMIGMTPCCYHHAIQFAKDLGFQPLTVLTQAVMCLGKPRDALLSVCQTR